MLVSGLPEKVTPSSDIPKSATPAKPVPKPTSVRMTLIAFICHKMTYIYINTFRHLSIAATGRLRTVYVEGCHYWTKESHHEHSAKRSHRIHEAYKPTTRVDLCSCWPFNTVIISPYPPLVCIFTKIKEEPRAKTPTEEPRTKTPNEEPRTKTPTEEPNAKAEKPKRKPFWGSKK